MGTAHIHLCDREVVFLKCGDPTPQKKQQLEILRNAQHYSVIQSNYTLAHSHGLRISQQCWTFQINIPVNQETGTCTPPPPILQGPKHHSSILGLPLIMAASEESSGILMICNSRSVEDKEEDKVNSRHGRGFEMWDKTSILVHLSAS